MVEWSPKPVLSAPGHPRTDEPVVIR